MLKSGFFSCSNHHDLNSGLVLIPSGDMKMPQKVVKKEKADEVNWREQFATKVVVANPGLEQVTKGDKLLLKFGNNLIARLMERKTARFTCYRKINGKRATLKVSNDSDEEELGAWITQQLIELKAKEPKTKSKKAKNDA